ncbi:MAG: hypothetical protein WC760_12785 [Bacteroidia bacterium]|jgi:hypothetical protein
MKTLIKTFILILTLGFTAQGQTKDVPLFDDYSIINRTVDSLLKIGTKEIVVFQTTRPFKYLKSSDSILTFICWQIADNSIVQIVTDKIVYSPLDFNGKEIFTYKDKIKTLVTEKEESQCTLQMIAPVISGNVLFYYSKELIGYFEHPESNSPTRYKPQVDKEKYRSTWYNLIYNVLTKENFNFKGLPNYDRSAGYK